MKGVILAGGKGLRLYPLTKVTNKHLLPVGKEPMILNPIRKLIEAGIEDILIITSTEHMGDIVNLLGSGKEYGCSFTYKVQEAALGIAHALGLAEGFANKEKIVVILGDNITTGSLVPFIKKFEKQAKGARILLKKVDEPNRFGVAAIDERQVLGIEEKPNQPKSDFAVIGYYMYDNAVFDIIRGLKPSGRGEYEITDVNNAYIKRKELSYDILNDSWTDAGTFESLMLANAMVMEKLGKESRKETGKVSSEQRSQILKEEEKKMKELKRLL